MIPKFLFLSLTLASLSFSSCSKTSRVAEATANKHLLLANGSEPKALDPALVSAVGDANIMRALFEGLVANHPSSDTIVEPGVAESWSSNDEFTVWDFKLRKDAKWSNGDPVTAGDFIYSYHRMLHPELASPYASMLWFIKNAEEFNREEISDFSKVGLESSSDHDLRITLKNPAPFFLQVLKHTSWLPVHQPTIEKFGTMTDQFTLWQRPGNHVGNGPFKLDSWKINRSVEVTPNPHYWDRDIVKLKKISFFPIPNEYTEERAFSDNQVHNTYTVAPSLIPFYQKHHPELIKIEPYAGSYFYRVNVNQKPLDDPKVRRALALAIDRKSIVEQVTLGGQIPATAFTPPSETGYSPDPRISHDPEEARRLLAEAGYPGGKGFPEINLTYNTQDSHRNIAVSIQDMWRRELGIGTINLLNQEWKVFQATIIDEKYDIARAGWIGDYTDPTTFLNMWRPGETNNNTGWANEVFAEALESASYLSDPNARFEKLREAENILMDDLPIIPLYWYTRVYLKHPDIVNWDPLILDNHPYKHIDLVSASEQKN